jgi:hypothetical protein
MTRFLRRMALIAALVVGSAGGALAGLVYEFDLGPDQEVPAVASSAFGKGKLTLDGLNATLELLVVGIDTADLRPVGPAATPIHIHDAPAGANGPILVNIPAASIMGNGLGFVSTSMFALTPEQADLIKAGLTYVNVHTNTFPGGEVRGQVVPLPAGIVLLGTALAGLGWVRHRRTRVAA